MFKLVRFKPYVALFDKNNKLVAKTTNNIFSNILFFMKNTNIYLYTSMIIVCSYEKMYYYLYKIRKRMKNVNYKKRRDTIHYISSTLPTLYTVLSIFIIDKNHINSGVNRYQRLSLIYFGR